MVRELRQEISSLKNKSREYDILKVWGKLLVDLREHSEYMIMGMLELIKEYKIIDNRLLLICYDKAKYDALTRESTRAILESYLKQSEIVGYDVELVDKKKNLSIIEVLKSKFDNIDIKE